MTNGKATGKDIIIEQIEINAAIIRAIIGINFIPDKASLNMIALYNTYKLIWNNKYRVWGGMGRWKDDMLFRIDKIFVKNMNTKNTYASLMYNRFCSLISFLYLKSILIFSSIESVRRISISLWFCNSWMSFLPGISLFFLFNMHLAMYIFINSSVIFPTRQKVVWGKRLIMLYNRPLEKISKNRLSGRINVFVMYCRISEYIEMFFIVLD